MSMTRTARVASRRRKALTGREWHEKLNDLYDRIEGAEFNLDLARSQLPAGHPQIQELIQIHADAEKAYKAHIREFEELLYD